MPVTLRRRYFEVTKLLFLSGGWIFRKKICVGCTFSDVNLDHIWNIVVFEMSSSREVPQWHGSGSCRDANSCFGLRWTEADVKNAENCSFGSTAEDGNFEVFPHTCCFSCGFVHLRVKKRTARGHSLKAFREKAPLKPGIHLTAWNVF